MPCTSSISPERECISVTTSIIDDSAASSAWITTSTPSPRMFSSASVTSAAISINLSEPRSSPVISQSIHTNSSRTALSVGARRARAALPPPGLGSSVSVAELCGTTGKGRSTMSTESAATPAQRIANGYAVDRPGAGIGHRRRRRRGRPDRADSHPAGHHQPARPGGRGDRNRQDQDAATDRRAAQRGGRPVLMADVKGDLSGLARPGEANDKTAARAKDTGDDWAGDGIPGGVPVAGHRGSRRAGARDRRQLRSGSVVESVGAQRYSGIDARADLPLGQGQNDRRWSP